ncbi:MAG: hypothetical protein LKJ81_02050 [Bacilli bacterium]|nr:hypothetical protein [Bacilli bacterium]MCH4277588.1 hypothetical protein [Bacilli bacterium]MCI2054927.1 hypothetical protein [Bacilli bacterium]
MKETKPSLTISFGLASQRKKISLEERAYNLMGAKCVDEDGIMLNGKKIIDGGDEILSTNLQLASLSSALQNEGFDVEVSHDAGRFICNEVYYLGLKNVKTALFVHLPPLKYSSKENNVSFLKALLKLLDV